MSDAFQPGLANLVATTGERVHRAPYVGTSPQQHRQSVELMRVKCREGRLDRRVIAAARRALTAAGLDGRNHVSIEQQFQCLLTYVQQAGIYTPDAVGAEVIQGAAATLCLDPTLCMGGGDCDDQIVALVSLCLSIGIPALIIVEEYPPMYAGHDPQGHVLAGVRTPQERYLYGDPSTKDAVHTSRNPCKRVFVDPMSDAPVEIVGFGRAPGGRGPLGFGDAQVGSTTIPGSWIVAPNNAVQAGLRYAVGIVVVPTLKWSQQDVQDYFAAGWLVEQVIPSTGTPGAGWVMIGLCRQAGTVVSTVNVDIVAVLQEAPTISGAGISTTGQTTLANPPPPATVVDLRTALFWTGGIALAAGVGWGLYRHSRRGGRQSNPIRRRR